MVCGINEAAFEKIHKTVSRYLLYDDDVIDVLNELTQLYFAKYNGNAKKMFLIVKQNEDNEICDFEIRLDYNEDLLRKNYLGNDIKEIYPVEKLIKHNELMQLIILELRKGK